MTPAERLTELLARWEELREQGVEATPEQLCPADPELRELLGEQVRRRRRLHALLDLPTAVMTAPPFPLSPPAGGVEVLAELGRGGLGVVYKAWQPGLKRYAALKRIQAGRFADPAQLARFRTEAEAAARLRHPNIVQVYELGERDGQPFLLLEYADGGSLAIHLAGTPQPPRPSAALVETLARAMHYAHQQGVVHRDLKPANVLIHMADGRWQSDRQQGDASSQSAICHLPSAIPKIADFGIAKLLDEAGGHTNTGDVIGTPSYMAPEQAAGRVRDAGPAIDVYGLGAVLYEMLTGGPPFRGTTKLETLELVRTHEPVPPRQLQPAVPRDLETVCLKCLEKDPDRRYASAEALAADLRRFLDGEPVTARPARWWGRAARWCRKRPASAALLAVAFLASAALVGWAVERGRRQAVELQAERERGRADRRDAAVGRQARGLVEAANRDNPEAPKVAEQHFRESLRLAELLDREQPGNPNNRLLQATGHVRLAELFESTKRPADAEKQFRQGLAVLEPLTRDTAGDRKYERELAKTYSRVAAFLRTLPGRLADAELFARQALAAWEGLAAGTDEPDDRCELAASHFEIGVIHRHAKREDQIDREWEKASTILEGLVRQQPTNLKFVTNYSLVRYNQALRVPAGRDDDRKIALNTDVIDTLEGVYREAPATERLSTRLGRAYQNRGSALGRKERFAESAADSRRAVELLEGPEQDAARFNLAFALAGNGAHAEAVREGNLAARMPAAKQLELLARVHARAARASRIDPALSSAEREAVVGEYAAQALGLLHRAKKAGLFQDPARAKELHTHPEYDPLRRHPDFQQFLRGVPAPPP
jgi:hypothetical protein